MTNEFVPSTAEAASALTDKVKPTILEMMVTTCEALYILAHIYVNVEKRFADAIKFLDHIESNIKIQRHSVAEVMAGMDGRNDQEQQLLSKSMLDAEAAKVVFARAMVAHHTCDDGACLKYTKSLIDMDTVRKNEEVFDLTLHACRILMVGQVASGGVKSADEDAFAMLFSKLELEKDSRWIHDAKIEQASSIVSGLDEMLRDDAGSS